MLMMYCQSCSNYKGPALDLVSISLQWRHPSIPITIVTQLKEACESGDKNIICCGFGIGLSWGTASFKISQNCHISDLIEVDEDGDDKVHVI